MGGIGVHGCKSKKHYIVNAKYYSTRALSYLYNMIPINKTYSNHYMLGLLNLMKEKCT